MKAMIALALTTLSISGAAVALADDNGGGGGAPAPASAAPTTTSSAAPTAAAAPTSAAPTTPAPPPSAVPVLNTGGASGSSNPGSSCVPRLALRNMPPAQSPVMLWNQNGDVGWPFGAPGPVPFAVPSTAPTVGCSR